MDFLGRVRFSTLRLVPALLPIYFWIIESNASNNPKF